MQRLKCIIIMFDLRYKTISKFYKYLNQFVFS